MIDTKGGHLLAEAVARKLLWIEPPRRAKSRLFVKLVSEGKWNVHSEQLTDEGYTLWGTKGDGTRSVRHVDDLDVLVSGVLRAKRG